MYMEAARAGCFEDIAGKSENKMQSPYLGPGSPTSECELEAIGDSCLGINVTALFKATRCRRQFSLCPRSPRSLTLRGALQISCCSIRNASKMKDNVARLAHTLNNFMRALSWQQSTCFVHYSLNADVYKHCCTPRGCRTGARYERGLEATS